MRPQQSILSQVTHRPFSLLALFTLSFLYLLAIFASFLSPYPISEQNLEKSYHPPTAILFKDSRLHVQVYKKDEATIQKYLPIDGQTLPIVFFAKGYSYKLLGLIPMERHLFQLQAHDADERIYILGSDALGRDMFSRLLHGAQISLSIGLIAIIITMFLGFVVGGLAGYFGGKFDFVAMRSVELLIAIPTLYLLLALRSFMAPHFNSAQMFLMIVVVLAMIGWAEPARIIRGMSLSISRLQFVLAARSMGQSTVNILRRHIFPNIFSYLIVAATLSIPRYIVAEAALSFLGLGIQEPSASWGLMLSQCQKLVVFKQNLWWLFSPGAAIFLTVFAFNVLGEKIRDIVDPKAEG